ncbi:unnamed protein product, partial [Musa acuminata subsp. burmannicoides]
MMALIPVNCWKTCITMAITNCGRLLLHEILESCCFTCRAISQACSIPPRTLCIDIVGPRIFFNMAKPSISISRSMRLVGVSAITMEPKQASSPALQPSQAQVSNPRGGYWTPSSLQCSPQRSRWSRQVGRGCLRLHGRELGAISDKNRGT